MCIVLDLFLFEGMVFGAKLKASVVVGNHLAMTPDLPMDFKLHLDGMSREGYIFKVKGNRS